MAAVTQFTDELNLVDSRFLEPVSSIIDVAVSICWLHLVVIIYLLFSPINVVDYFVRRVD